MTSLPRDKTLRKQMPLARGVLDYFPEALALVAFVSYVGNQQHNPGQPLHWAKDKSTDHADTILRHAAERGGFDEDKVDGRVVHIRHSGKLAWRALANLQIELEEAAKAAGITVGELLERELVSRDTVSEEPPRGFAKSKPI